MGGVFGFGTSGVWVFMIIVYQTHPSLPVHETDSLRRCFEDMKWVISVTHQQLKIETIQKFKLCFGHYCLEVPFSLHCINALSQKQVLFLEQGSLCGNKSFCLLLCVVAMVRITTKHYSGSWEISKSVINCPNIVFQKPLCGKDNLCNVVNTLCL